MKETVLLFQITDKKMKTAITTALLPLKIKVKQIPPQDNNKKLGILAGLLQDDQAASSETDKNQALPLTDSMMILCGIEGTKIDRLLTALRSKKVYLPYKAVLTPVNQEWTPQECLEELKKEHETFAGGASIHKEI